MDESSVWTLGLVVGIALLYLGSRLRSRSVRRRRPPGSGGSDGSE